ncbi:MAG TPA: DUF6084 family protein [Polyangiaceae bacterium]|jgi:hypothetical protein|nr:DUF6084 family protein [Polyangiaceae bacterium]
MGDLVFEVVRAAAVEHAASPSIALTVAIAAPGMELDGVLLRASVRIEASRRSHDAAERERLRELFGGDDVWARSPKSLLWAQTTSLVPSFTDAATAEVVLPCSYDLAASAFRYLHGLRGGNVPLTVQFSGTVFQRSSTGLRVVPIPWDRETTCVIPLALFKDVIDAHFPGGAVVGLGRDVFERLDAYRRSAGLRTIDEAVNALLAAAGEERVA